MIKELISRIKGHKEQPKQVQEQPKAFEAYKELRDMQNAASSFDFKQMENNPLKMSVEEQNSILSNNYPKPTLKDNTGKKYAMDGGMGGHYNPNSMITTSGRADDRIFEFYGNHGFIGWQLCAIIYQNWLVANACNVPVEDALRPLWKTTLTKGEEEAPELAKDLNDKVFKQYKLADKLRKHGINMKQFGVSYAMLCLEENHDYTKPFNIDGIMPGQFKGVAIIDPYWVMPNWSAHNLNNPTDPDFYEPEFYTIQGQTRVHKSYIVKVINQEVADIIKPSYYFGGVPLTQQIYERIYAAERTANEAPLLALTKRLLVVPTNLRAIIENPRIAWDMVKMLVTNRDNQGVYFTEDGEGNNVHQVDTSLSDMDAVIMSQYQLVASIARIPAHKLLKTDPRGMNNSGDYSIKDYIQELQSLQEKAFRTLIERVNEIVLRAELGEKEAVQNVEFEPIDMPSEMDKAQVEQISAQTASAYVTAGILTPEEVREVLRNDKGGKWAGIAEELPSEEFPEDLLDPTDNNPEGGVPGLEDMATDEWEESKHKRDENGQFSSNGASGAKQETKQETNKQEKVEKTEGKYKDREITKTRAEFYGEEFKGYKGKEAIEKLIKEGRGHIKGAFHRNDIGDIDLVWGDELGGMNHLVKRREETGLYEPSEILQELPNIVEKGEIRVNQEGKFEIWHDQKMAVISPDYLGEKVRWVITGFKQRKPNKKAKPLEGRHPGSKPGPLHSN